MIKADTDKFLCHNDVHKDIADRSARAENKRVRELLDKLTKQKMQCGGHTMILDMKDMGSIIEALRITEGEQK